MISFDYTFQSTDPVHWLILVALGAIPLIMAWLLWKNTTLAPDRLWLRAGLNLLLWLLLVAYCLQPVWKTTSDRAQALLVGHEVPTAEARRVQDSLGLPERFSPEEFVQKKLATHFDSITLLGQDFPTELMAQIGSASMNWVPFYDPDRLQAVHWRSVVRRGEIQQITGQINSSQKQWLKVSFAGQTLDSTLLDTGTQSFSLRFPAFAEGRTSTELYLADQLLDSVRYFTRPVPRLSYQFILSNPDFESRTLAEWLGQKGSPVSVVTTVSKGVQSTTTINGGVPANALPDLVITDPSNAANGLVKKALNAGKSILFINLTQPEVELPSLNRSLGTAFSARRTSTESTIPISTLLTALPYTFSESLPQIVTPGYPVAVWNKAGRVGVSLLSETFPLKLSGDSTSYEKLWNTVFAQTQPATGATLTATAPLFKGIPGVLSLNSVSQLPASITIGTDSLPVLPSPLNDQTADIEYLFGKAGWVPLGDSIEVFVEDSTSALLPTVRTTHYLRAFHASRYTRASQSNKPSREAKLPDWAWQVLFILVATALWVEPKL